MKLIIVATLALVAAVSAAPASLDAEAVVVHSELDQQPNGAFVSSYETSNGIRADAQGELKEALDEDNKPQTVLVIRGSYSYPGADGKPEVVTYFADETGYHAEGASIPKEQPARR